MNFLKATLPVVAGLAIFSWIVVPLVARVSPKAAA